MKDGWKQLGVPVTHAFRIPGLSRACQIVLFFLADSANDFNPGNSDLAEKIGADRKNVGRYTSELEKKSFIVRNGIDDKSRSIWLINTETVRKALKLGHVRCHQSEDARQQRCHQSEDGGCHQSEDGGAINLRTQPSNKPSNLTFKVEEKSAEAKAKKKAKSSKAKIKTWNNENTLSRIFTLLNSLEPYRHVFDVPTDTDYLTSFMNGKTNLSQQKLEEIVEDYVRYYRLPGSRTLTPKGVRQALGSWIKRDVKRNPPEKSWSHENITEI